MDHNHYTAEISPEIASRFPMMAGIGMPARRATCLLELQLHAIKMFGEARAEKINKTLYSLVWDWYHWADSTGQRIVRFAGI